MKAFEENFGKQLLILTICLILYLSFIITKIIGGKMIDLNCPKCKSDYTTNLYNYIEDIETLENGDIIIYYFCYKCHTEFEIVYHPIDKFITTEN